MKLRNTAFVFLGVLSTVACISVPLSASAATLSFDDFSYSINDQPPYVGLYNGFTFNNFYAFNGAYLPNSGYAQAVVSPSNGIFSSPSYAGISYAGVLSSTVFTFNSAYITAAWNDGLQVSIQGFNGSTQLFSQTISPSATLPKLYTFDWAGIDSLRFRSFGGTQNSNYVGTSSQFALDNFTYNDSPKPVPVPGAILGVGVAGGLLGRRLLKDRKAKASV